MVDFNYSIITLAIRGFVAKYRLSNYQEISIDGELNIQTATIFDPFQSYYYFPITEEANEFFNLYFDLAEMHRRRLEKLIIISEKEEEIIQQYNTIK